MIIRLALEADIPDIIDLARTNCALSTPHLTFSAEKVVETVYAYLDHCATTMWVAEQEDGEIVGLLVATINEYRHAYGLYTTQEVLFVKPERRGSRAAALLMKELVRWSIELGAIEITGGNDNKLHSEKTAKFLSRFGFEEVGYFMRRMLKNG